MPQEHLESLTADHLSPGMIVTGIDTPNDWTRFPGIVARRILTPYVPCPHSDGYFRACLKDPYLEAIMFMLLRKAQKQAKEPVRSLSGLVHLTEPDPTHIPPDLKTAGREDVLSFTASARLFISRPGLIGSIHTKVTAFKLGRSLPELKMAFRNNTVLIENGDQPTTPEEAVQWLLERQPRNKPH